MKTFEIEITELLSRIIKIEAHNKNEAIIKAIDMYRNEEIILDNSDYLTTEYK